jgi:hypothetical protein
LKKTLIAVAMKIATAKILRKNKKIPNLFFGYTCALKTTARKPAEAIKYRSRHMFFMLSKCEIEFLRNPEKFSPDYARSLRHRIKAKRAQIQDELSLLSVAEINNGATDCSNNNPIPKYVDSMNQGVSWSLRRDLDPRPLPYQGNAPPG